MISYHDIVFFKRPADSPALLPVPAHLRVSERSAEAAAHLAALEHTQSRQRSLSLIQARFQRGLRLFVMEQSGRDVAWCWMAIGTWRYIDELCWRIELQPDQIWARDVYVIPQMRGQRLMQVMASGIHDLLGRALTGFSDVDANNAVSLRAHVAAGFVRQGRVRALQCGQRLLLRSMAPDTMPAPQALRPQARWLWKDAAELEWHRNQIA